MCSEPEATQPILNLFRAWERLDPSLYGEQWTADAVQLYGHGKQRLRAKIISDREALMGRLESVTTSGLDIAVDEQTGSRARYLVRYEMRYRFKTGRVVSDANDEIYEVVCDSGAWKIALNDNRK